ncbi:envelope stress response regulator transcription factor CpxR [Thorsellia kenyensis]|uniref:Envelope stress response regulator transcription factor CpxR n=1 Tax=Thorsellia kenyensis TaxID=1549888 RepID=A0ABV6C9P6_9GAMM
MNKIMLVDDDRELTSLLKQLLELDGFQVVVAHDGVEALEKLDDSVHLVLLDIMMPNKNGLDALREIRQNYTIPIIMLTAKGGELDRVLGLELGADDYLAKPFNDRELLARIRALLRRSVWTDGQNQSQDHSSSDDVSPVIQIDGLTLYPGRQEARFDDQVLDLTGTEFTLLYLLAKNIGLVVSRDDLSMEVLGKPLSPFDRAVDMHVSNLRRKLPDRKDGLPWFKTLRSRGYLMVAVG